MSKKTFFSVLWLIVGCGVLALLVIKVASTFQEQRKKAAAIWTVNANSSEVHQLAFEPDSKSLISVGVDTRKWDVATGQLKSKLPRKGNSWLRYSPDAKYYAYGVYNRYANPPSPTTVNLHDAHTDTLLQTFVLPNEANKRYVSIDEVVFSNRGALLNINYMFHNERLKNQRSTSTEVFTVWDIRTKRQLRSYSRKVTDRERRTYNQDPFFSPDNRQLLLLETEVDSEGYTSVDPLKVNLQNLLSNKTVATYTIAPDADSLIAGEWVFASVSPDSSSIVAVNGGMGNGFAMSGEKSTGTLYAFSSHTQKVLWKHYANKLVTEALAFSPDGKLLAWGGWDLNPPHASSYATKGKLLLLDAQSGKVISELTEKTWLDGSKQEQISRVDRIGGILGIKPKSTGVPRHLPGDSGRVSCLAFSPDGKMLAVGYSGGLIKLWRVPQK